MKSRVPLTPGPAIFRFPTATTRLPPGSPSKLSPSSPAYSAFLRPGSVFIGSQSSVDHHHHSPLTQHQHYSNHHHRQASPGTDDPLGTSQPVRLASASHFERDLRLHHRIHPDHHLPTPQCLDHHETLTNPPEWTVRVTITHSDHRTGKLAGMMQADGLFNNTLSNPDHHPRPPRADPPLPHHDSTTTSTTMIITAWEGEIIDLKKSPKQLWTNELEDEGRYKIGPLLSASVDPTRSRHHLDQINTFGSISHSNDLRYWSKTKAFFAINPDSIFDILQNDPAFIDALDSRFILMRWKETNFVNCEPTQSGLSIQGFYYVCLEKQTGLVEAYYYDPASLPYQKLQLKPIGTNGFGFGSMKLV
ncbi:hypothetical protein PTTG_05973 [Puccinia triticina 1-1 BBBD Race 1]|uniref:Uncharacterized protein n=1 Tax=Puccinia triticina (isolate 1-1 / race 1 (BBBD)) TaxID=630390 RepID=A0A180GVD3_PUCT1|nr:hypothetical protein PTTG_05973 [Puccinia triticina 1-1 BBBD Race 1]